MAITDYNSTPGLNTAINGINVAEGCAPGNINDAIRQMMADLKTYDATTLPAAYQAKVAGLTSWAAITRAAGFDTFAATPSSANLRALLSDEVGTGAAYFIGGALGTPASGTLTNCTGLPFAGLAAAAVVTEAEGIASNDNDTTIPTSAAVKGYVDANAPNPIKAWVNFNGRPLSGTYSRTGTTVTVTISSHGLTTGMIANLDFTTGTATDGSYSVTVTDANNFTVTDAASGATSGNVTMNLHIKAAFNVSSITDNGVGDYTINFTSALADANYAVSGNALTNTAGAVQGGWAVAGSGSPGATTLTLKSTTQLRILAGLPNSTGAADMNDISVMVIR